ncbi:MAG: thymidine phosphorylase family protein [Pseudomonadota bacterium]
MSALPPPLSLLGVQRMGIDTYQEPVIYLRADCPVCRAEGFEAYSRVRVQVGSRSVIATLNTVSAELLGASVVGLSEAAWRALVAAEGELAVLSHPEPLESFSEVRRKIYGHSLPAASFTAIVRDLCAGRYSGLEVAAFVTACAGDALSLDETIHLTRAMVDTGQTLRWSAPVVADKHCIGGLPGNRTTPIVVAIVAACGLTIPKTSSRAITSPAGTADTMETLAPVALDLVQMRRVVEREGGCIVWGGAMALAPADDVLIRVERPLDLDSEGQLAASVISKKVAAGASHVLLDLPVGATAKLRTAEDAQRLARRLRATGEAFGLQLQVLFTDGEQPVGRGIGPALEARDVLAVLHNQAEAPADLRERALQLAAALLELAGRAPPGQGLALARSTLLSGLAWAKFAAICEAQGGLRTPPRAAHRREFTAPQAGVVRGIDNRRLARLAKLAGAPLSPAAGIELRIRLGDHVARAQPLFCLHAESPGELDYAASYARDLSTLIRLEHCP